MKYLIFIPKFIMFNFFYLKEMINSNIAVAKDILRPSFKMRPAIIEIPLDCETDFQIMLLANLITMTPGTLSLDVSNDKKVLFIHAIHIDDPDDLRRATKEGLERKIMEVFK